MNAIIKFQTKFTKVLRNRWVQIVLVSGLGGVGVIYLVLGMRGIVSIPQYIELFGVQIRLYAVSILIGILVATWIYEHLRKQVPSLQKLDVWDALFYVLIPGIIGARLYHVFTEFELYQDDLFQILAFNQGGIGIIGGFIGGVIGGVWYLRKKDISVVDAFGVLVIVTPIAQAIGRLGNFFNQELFGLPADLPWALYIRPSQNTILFLQEYVLFHPLFLYEAIWNLMLGIGLYYLWKYRQVHGSTLVILYISGYGLIRYLLDFIRVEGRPGILVYGVPITYTQVLIMTWFLSSVIFGLVYQIWHKRRYGKWFTDKREIYEE